MSTWEEFQQWWATEVQPGSASLATNSEALYYLALLEKIKKQAKSIGVYLQMRQMGRDTNGKGMTEAGVQRLISAGFVDVGFKGQYNEQAGPNSAITKIRNSQRQDMAKLAKWLVPILEKVNTNTADNLIKSLKKVAGPNLDGVNGNIDVSFSKEIGNIFEYISSVFSIELENGIRIEMENVAAEKTGKNSKTYKADTKHTFTIGEVQFSLLSSDKTGMEAVFGKESGKMIGYLDKFTAGLQSTNLKLVDNNQIETIVDWKLVDPRLNDLFAYIVKNADYFNSRDEEGKNLVVSFFAWAKLITELVGAENAINDMPAVVRMFNRLYKTSDILRKFSNVHGVDIMNYVQKTYLYDYYKTLQDVPTLDKKQLRQVKGDAMSKIKGRVSYALLKEAIKNTLMQVNDQVTRQSYFKTNFRILLGNVENLKELV